METASKPALPWSIKICGITRLVDAVAAVQAGADAIGLNFYARSLRFIPPETAKVFVHEAKSWKVTPVGVFVNHSSDAIRGIADRSGIQWVQLHGDEPDEVADQLIDLNIVRVIRVGCDNDFSPAIQLARLWSTKPNVRAILIDSPIRRRLDEDDDNVAEFGGTGKTADWHVSKQLVEQLELPIVLAGGLNPENVTDAIAQVRPAAVDVASGVEGLPGQKNHDQLQKFITNAKAAFHS